DQQRIPGGVPGASRGTYGGADVENVYRAEGGSATPGSVVRAIGRVEHRPPSVVRKGAPAHHHATGFMRMLQVIYEFRWVLMGTAGSWLIFDITFYANGLFSGTILESIGIAGKADADHLTQHDLAAIALTNIIITCIGLPGYITAVLCIDRIGRRNLQLLGFTAVAVVFVLMGAFLTPLEGHSLTWLFVALYGLTFFFANFGPNTTTFVIPSESFPTRARATCHGLSAASGKMGAVIGGATLHPLMETYGSAPDQQREGLRLDMGSANLAELDKAGAADDAEEREAYDAVVTPGGFSIPELSAADSVLSEDGGEVGAGSRRFGSKPASSVNTPEGK
ncbi:PHT1-13, partial [Symbiodinium sp. KB8]